MIIYANSTQKEAKVVEVRKWNENQWVWLLNWRRN